MSSAPLAATYTEAEVERWQDHRLTRLRDCVAEEVPVALLYNGVPNVVMLATPQDLDDFAIGFSLSEGILQRADEIQSISVRDQEGGIEVLLRIPPERMRMLAERERNLTGRTGCGLCGTRYLEQAIRHPAPVQSGVLVRASVLYKSLNLLNKFQTLNSLTGAVHAAAWVSPAGEVLCLREDVGRHNALDKLIGALARTGADFAAGFCIVTSRASYEMVQKAATLGMGFLVAISAPTGLAIRLAQETGPTLIGFARSGSHVVYANAQRLVPDQAVA